MSATATAKVTVSNKLGLHARPAMLFAECAQRHDADVQVHRDGDPEKVDGKSIMHLMMLAATKGTDLVIEATGDDAQAAVDALISLVASGFNEAD